MKCNERKYVVYMHRCNINKKVYIGQTCRGINTRWGVNGKKYLQKRNGLYVHPHFARAIIKYGWDNFEHIVLFENLDKKDADRMEKICIFMFKANNINYGYNCNNGGSDGFTGMKHSEETKRKIGEKSKGKMHTEETKRKISAIKIGHKNTPTKPVLCIEEHKIYESMKDIYEKYNVSRSCVDDVCAGRMRTLLGKHWIYLDKFSINYLIEILMMPDSLKFVPVICVETNTLYTTASDASRKTQVDCSGILRCIKGQKKTAGGYHWEDGTEKWMLQRRQIVNDIVNDFLSDVSLMNQINEYKLKNLNKER